MKAGMSDDAELFIKAEEAPVSQLDQGSHSQTMLHMLSAHRLQLSTMGPKKLLLK